MTCCCELTFLKQVTLKWTVKNLFLTVPRSKTLEQEKAKSVWKGLRSETVEADKTTKKWKTATKLLKKHSICCPLFSPLGRKRKTMCSANYGNDSGMILWIRYIMLAYNSLLVEIGSLTQDVLGNPTDRSWN